MATFVRASERRAQLLEAAATVLVRDGYQALTLRAVASQAGVRLSTLQYIFPTRTDLLRAVADKVADDCGYHSFTLGHRGLGAELKEVAHWYGQQVLRDPGMRELLRAEFIATVSPQALTQDDLPAGAPLLAGLLTADLQQMHDRGHEAWAVPPAQLATLCRHTFVGLTFDLLRTGDTDAYEADVTTFIDTIVALADPKPRAA